MEDTFKPVLGSKEPALQHTQSAPGECTELAAETRATRLESRGLRSLPSELHGNTARGPVSPIEGDQHPGLAKGNTYDDPRLVQNPWAQDDTRQAR
jgi:hypothetical protein